MEIQADFRELLELLNVHNVDYLIVGGYALAFHGVPRLTGDLDILVKPAPENAKRIMKALDEFGFGSVEISSSDFISLDRVIELGYPPVRIDIMTSISGVTIEEAFGTRIKGKYGNVDAYYLGRDQFIANKRATGRKRDIADLETLGEE